MAPIAPSDHAYVRLREIPMYLGVSCSLIGGLRGLHHLHDPPCGYSELHSAETVLDLFLPRATSGFAAAGSIRIVIAKKGEGRRQQTNSDRVFCTFSKQYERLPQSF